LRRLWNHFPPPFCPPKVLLMVEFGSPRSVLPFRDPACIELFDFYFPLLKWPQLVPYYPSFLTVTLSVALLLPRRLPQVEISVMPPPILFFFFLHLFASGFFVSSFPRLQTPLPIYPLSRNLIVVRSPPGDSCPPRGWKLFSPS